MADEGPDPAVEAERQELLRKLEELRVGIDATAAATGGLRAAARPPGPVRELGAFFGAALLGGGFLLANQLALATMDLTETAAWKGGPGASLEVGGGVCLVAGLVPLWIYGAGLAALAPPGLLWREPLLAAVAASLPAAIGGVLIHFGDPAADLLPEIVLLSSRTAATATFAALVWLLVLGLRLRRRLSEAAAPTGSP